MEVPGGGRFRWHQLPHSEGKRVCICGEIIATRDRRFVEGISIPLVLFRDMKLVYMLFLAEQY